MGTELMGTDFGTALWHEIVLALIFGFIGVAMCSVFFWILVRISPFSIRKEIEEDQNISLGLILGAAIIGISIIIAAAIH
jgi:putative membrane protein